MKAIILSSSPRRDGNSAQLAVAVSQGITEAGHEAEVVFAGDVLESLSRRLPHVPPRRRRMRHR